MTTDSGPGQTQPYADQTQQNTGSTAWLDSYGKIKADFGSLAQYAMNMQTASMDLLPASATLYQIPQLTTEAFTSSANVLPEAQLVAQTVALNFKDFVSMLTDLHAGLLNIAYAAQTISDAYHLSDGSNAADINSLVTVDGVDFAFGMGGTRPAGLDSHIGKTVQEDGGPMSQAQTAAGALGAAGDPSQYGGTTSVSYLSVPGEPTTKITTITYPDGSKIQVEQTTGWDGTAYTQYSVVGADGNTVASSRKTTTTSGASTTVVTEVQDQKSGAWQPSNTQTTTTGTGADGSKVTTTTTSTTQNGKQVPTTTQTQTDKPDGSTTTVTTTHNSDGTSNTQVEAVGSNDNNTSDQQGSNDPKAAADKTYTTFTQKNLV
jgi:hypothetical protein